MQRTPCAVVGVGYVGRFHAQKYAAHEHAELVAVVDIDPATAERVASECGCEALTDYRGLLDRVEAVSIAVPTVRHFAIAREFLARGIHVLLEKPMTSTIEEARELNRLARDTGAALQIGHLERFNAAFRDIAGIRPRPLFIESHRVAPFKPRGTDVSVVLDLMIHDIDLILGLVDSPIRTLSASGTPVLSDDLDIVNARLEFESGCVANVTASRVSVKSERRMRIFQPEAYISIDFQNASVAVHRIGAGEMMPGVPEILREESTFDSNDSIHSEIDAFLGSVRQHKPVVVSGEDGLRALETAVRISALIDAERLRHAG
ncbi:MAG: Gfo/Idh/MocA family oxidoreductase [Pseudomonadota bacterium]|nr:MAG: Gfo/Idh/MocA family oxidoreductase [Pseudomonadota bacterium]